MRSAALPTRRGEADGLPQALGETTRPFLDSSCCLSIGSTVGPPVFPLVFRCSRPIRTSPRSLMVPEAISRLTCSSMGSRRASASAWRDNSAISSLVIFSLLGSARSWSSPAFWSADCFSSSSGAPVGPSRTSPRSLIVPEAIRRLTCSSIGRRRAFASALRDNVSHFFIRHVHSPLGQLGKIRFEIQRLSRTAICTCDCSLIIPPVYTLSPSSKGHRTVWYSHAFVIREFG